MKKNLLKYLFLTTFAFTVTIAIGCRENKNTDDLNRYDSLPEQERLYGDPDPLNERDASGGTIENHQERTANKTDIMNDKSDTLDRGNNQPNTNKNSQENH